MTPDLVSTFYGPLLILSGQTGRGRSWLRRHLHISPIWIGDHRIGVDILTACIVDGLRIRDASHEDRRA